MAQTTPNHIADEIVKLHCRGLNYRAIADRCGVDRSTAQRIVYKWRYGINTSQSQAAYIPTPEEISASCERIRCEWDDETEWERCGRTPPYEIPKGRVVE